MDFGTVAIVGVGLIGGSVGLALRVRRLASKVVGIGYRRTSLDKALQRGAVDEATTDLAAGVAEADLVLLGTPVDRTVELVGRVRAVCRPAAVLTDVGSTKRLIVDEIDALEPAGAAFVGGHPLAGLEERGVDAARDDLFDGRTCVLTPTVRTPRAATTRVTRFWEALGTRVVTMDAAEHDLAVAAVSHMPHLVAAAVVRAVGESHRPLAATGFASTTRIAGGDPSVWLPIFRQNRDGVLAALDAFGAELDRLRRAVGNDDGEELDTLLQDAKRIRDAMAS